MKNKFSLALLVIFFLLFETPLAHAQMMNPYTNEAPSPNPQSLKQAQQTLDKAVQDVLKIQNVSSKDQLDCSKITDVQFEKVGDAWMGVRAGTEDVHNRMEQMMGGEGSNTLKQAHIQMGKTYLGCLGSSANTNMPMLRAPINDASRGGVFPMMGWGYGYGNMMNSYGWGFGIVAFLFWLVAFVDLVLLGVFLWKKIKK